MRQTLWTKNFTIITLGTVISAIGGVAISFALGFVVFDTTGSTLAACARTLMDAGAASVVCAALAGGRPPEEDGT